MQMTFHTNPQETVLLESWNVRNGFTMLWVCLLVVVTGVLLEVIKYWRWKITREQTFRATIVYEPLSTRLLSPIHIAQSLLFLGQLVLSYALMLIFMTFSVWLGIAVIVGLAIGYCTFGQRTENSR